MRSLLPFLVACASATPVVAPTPNTPPASNVVPTAPIPTPEGCAPSLVSRPEVFGAVAVAPDGEVFVAGATDFGTSWQLARFDPVALDLELLMEQPSLWNEADFIEVDQDEVRIREFYPNAQDHVFDRYTQSFRVESNHGNQGLRVAETTRGITTFSVDRSLHDVECANYCIFSDTSGQDAVVLFDDAEVDYSIHGNMVEFVGDWVYFMATASEQPRSLRRVSLIDGTDELVFAVDAFTDNLWISNLIERHGVLYWLRTSSQYGQVEAFIDAHVVVANETWLHTPIGPQPRNLKLAEEQLLWVDQTGVNSVSLQPASAPSLLVDLATASTSYFDVLGESVWYTASFDTDGQEPVAELGCVGL